jgi:hypothetical protein
MAINRRLALAEQVEIGTVDDVDERLHARIPKSEPRLPSMIFGDINR